MSGLLELAQKAEVVFEEEADVGDVVFSHSEPFNTETKGPAGILFAVIADGFEDVGVDHAAAAHFNPCFFAVFAH